MNFMDNITSIERLENKFKVNSYILSHSDVVHVFNRLLFYGKILWLLLKLY